MTKITLKEALNILDMLNGNDEDFDLALETLNALKVSDLTKALLFNITNYNSKNYIKRREKFNISYLYHNTNSKKTYQLINDLEPTELNKQLFEIDLNKKIKKALDLDIKLELKWIK